MTTQRATVPSHSVPSNDYLGSSQLSSDLRLAVCSDAPLLIRGSRDAARLVARVVHDHNPSRRAARFVSVTHDVLAEKLAPPPVSSLQSLLGSAIGLEDTSDGLTLFIDSVDQLTPAAQDMLMYYLDVVCASSPTPEDPEDQEGRAVRVVAATTRDLSECVAAGSFRSDLFYRLNVIQLSMPSAWKAGGRQLHTLLATLSA